MQGTNLPAHNFLMNAFVVIVTEDKLLPLINATCLVKAIQAKCVEQDIAILSFRSLAQEEDQYPHPFRQHPPLLLVVVHLEIGNSAP